MDGNNRNNYVPQRGRHNFGRHPNLDREKFLPEFAWRETDIGDPRETDNGAGPARPAGEETSGRLTDPYPVSAEDIRLHAWLVERLMLLHYEQHGLWPRFRRFLFGNRPIRWLVLHSLGEKDLLRKTQSDVRDVLGDRSPDAAWFRKTQFRPYQG